MRSKFKRAVDLILQGAQGVRDALDGVLQGVLEVVHRVDAPLVARAVVVMAQDAVERRVAHQHVRGGHVDLGAQHAGAVRELALLHAAEQVQVLLHAAVPVGAVDAGGGEGAAIGAHLLGGLVVHVGHALADEVAGDLIQAIEEIGREVQLVPFEAEPLDVLLDARHEHRVLLGGVGVVKAQVAGAAVFFGDAEVDAQGLAVSNVQKAVRLRREAGVYVVVATVRQILLDKLLYKVRSALFFVCHGAGLLQ